MAKLAVIDFETTGLMPGEDEVLQVSIVDETGAVLMNEYCCPVRHTQWAAAQKVNGITPERVAGRPPFEAFAAAAGEILAGAQQVVAYNAAFERAFLAAYGVHVEMLRWAADPMDTFSACFGSQKRRLTTAAGFFGYQFSAHDALADAQAARIVFQALESGPLLRWVMRGAQTAVLEGAKGPVACETLDDAGMLRLLKATGLCPLTAAEPKPLVYKGIRTAAPVPCRVLGFQDRSREGDWVVLVLEAAGSTICVCDDYLREMQSPGFGQEEQEPRARVAQGGGEASARRRKNGPEGPEEQSTPRMGSGPSGATGVKGAGNARFAAFARKSAAIKNVETNTAADPTNPFYGKNVVFTGDMTMPREAAAQAVAERGAFVRSSVSSKTDFLVAGAQDVSLVGEKGRSGKEQKALELNAAGKADIRLLDESEFRALLLHKGGVPAAPTQADTASDP